MRRNHWISLLLVVSTWSIALFAAANPGLVFGWAGAGGFLIVMSLCVLAVASTFAVAVIALAYKWRVGSWLLVLSMGWIGLLTVNLLRLPIAGTIWMFYFGVLSAAWIVAMAVSIAAFRAAFVLESAKLAAAIVAIGTVGAGLAMTMPWNDIYAVGYFRLNAGAFDQVATVARERPMSSDLADHRQAALPPTLSSVSVSGDLLVAGGCGDELVLFAPMYFGIPDGAIGYINSSCSIEALRGAFLDGEGDDLHPRIDLGGGWWWAD